MSTGLGYIGENEEYPKFPEFRMPLRRHEPLLGRRVRCPRTEVEHRLSAGVRPGHSFVCPGCGYWVDADGTTRWPSLTSYGES